MDFCPNTNLKVKQHPDMFHMNTDSYLLGTFMKLKKNDIVLDVGTNNGVLLLYASLQKPKALIGLDVFEEAISLAKENMMLNQVDAQLYVSSFQDFNQKVDVIVCNPPYFSGDNRNENHFLKVARHEEYLDMDTLFSKSKSLLNDKGRMFLIYPASRLQELSVIANNHGFAIKNLEFAMKKDKKRVHTVCVHCVRRGNMGIDTINFVTV
ncbi:hypothetical protein AOC36_02415 [Erysipelothrix larvae]|uniref:Methyltransferase small domain-containing protein n=1 Tax=Erysipelothrix larvae TaxID=1514105 RepID=A0A0X8GYQ7_9FIRM|nr:methyltransferase [Erysipelothrix larvae]AMC92876.1 hypothetical protein AOC36_02415 [Erysipelothrix larvae]